MQFLAAPSWSISTTNNIDLSLGVATVATTTTTTTRSTTTNNIVNLSFFEATKNRGSSSSSPEHQSSTLTSLDSTSSPYCQPPHLRFEEAEESREHRQAKKEWGKGKDWRWAMSTMEHQRIRSILSLATYLLIIAPPHLSIGGNFFLISTDDHDK